MGYRPLYNLPRVGAVDGPPSILRGRLVAHHLDDLSHAPLLVVPRIGVCLLGEYRDSVDNLACTMRMMLELYWGSAVGMPFQCCSHDVLNDISILVTELRYAHGLLFTLFQSCSLDSLLVDTLRNLHSL